MAFHETLFPTEISYGSSAGPGFNTKVLTTDGGREYRNPRWTAPLRHYDVAENVKKDRDLATLLSFFLARGGAEHGFRYKDWSDYTTGAKHTGTPSFGDQPLTQVDSTGLVYQLEKRYVDDVFTHVRGIQKPVADTVRLGQNGTELVGGWSVDSTTGKVTFATPPGPGLTWGGEFHVPVRFTEEVDKAFSVSLDDFETGSVNIPLVELRPEDAVAYEDFFFGGSCKHVTEDAIAVSLGRGRVHVFQPMIPGLFATLPAIANIPPGGPVFYLVNQGPNPIDVRDEALVSLVTIPANSAVELLVTVDAAANKLWKAF